MTPRDAFEVDEDDPYAGAAEDFIRGCGGEPREAVKMLLGANDYLERRLRALEASVSWAYRRERPGGR